LDKPSQLLQLEEEDARRQMAEFVQRECLMSNVPGTYRVRGQGKAVAKGQVFVDVLILILILVLIPILILILMPGVRGCDSATVWGLACAAIAPPEAGECCAEHQDAMRAACLRQLCACRRC